MNNMIDSDILRLDQNNPDALLVRGLCLYYQDNIDKAFAHFKQVLVMAPDHVKARDAFKVSNGCCPAQSVRDH